MQHRTDEPTMSAKQEIETAELVSSPSNGEANRPAIVAENLTKTYSAGVVFRKKHQALKGLSFTVNQGEVFGLLGPNGAGKTTFIKVLLGIIKKSGGNASMLGHPAGSKRGRQAVGYLPERLRIPPHLSAYGALDYFGNLSNLPSNTVRARRDEYLELVGLKGRERDLVKKFSKGMVQRLGLAQAMLHEPKMIILDEPTDGLDPRARAEMRAIISSLAERGVTIFFNSHLLQEVEMICQRVAILDKGVLRYCGSVSEIGQFLSTGAAGPAHKVRFELSGDANSCKAAFTGLKSKQVSQNGPLVTIEADLQSLSQIDRIVDELRAKGVSITGIQSQRVSLEDAFLQLTEIAAETNSGN